MKATINKSQLMKRAWSIFKSGHSFYSLSFSIALERAWEVEKANVEFAVRKEREAEEAKEYARRREASRQYRANRPKMQMSDSQIESYYANGAYSGD